MMKQVIPEEVWTQHVAILAKTGKGKTVAAKGGMTALLRAKMRCGAFDPTGGWWGMRLKADGKMPAFPLVIFGGMHADIAIDETMGAKIGKLAAESDFSWIIDTKKMTRDQRTRFATEFAEAIFAANHRRLHLFVDECHLMIPKEKMASRAVGKMTTVWNDLVTGGRSNGFCITLISQRPQKVHNDALAQCETLITLGMLLPHDIDAVKRWVTVKDADSKDAKDMIASLPGLPRGEGWIYAPEMNMLKRVKFPMIDTFDSSAAPDAGADLRAPPVELGQIDLEAIRASLAPPVRKVVAIASIAPRPATPVRATVSGTGEKLMSESIALRDRETAFAAGKREGWGEGYGQGWLDGDKSGFDRACGAAVKALETAFRTAAKVTYTPGTPPRRVPAPKTGHTSPSGRAPAAASTGPVQRQPTIRDRPAARWNGVSGLSGPQAKILESLAWWVAMGHGTPTRAQTAIKAGMKANGGHFRGRLSELSGMGFVTYPSTDLVAMTDAGAAVAPEPNINQTVVDTVRPLLSGPQTKIFDAMLAGHQSREDIALAAEMDATGGHFRGRLSELSSFEIVEYPDKGSAKLQDWVTA